MVLLTRWGQGVRRAPERRRAVVAKGVSCRPSGGAREVPQGGRAESPNSSQEVPHSGAKPPRGAGPQGMDFGYSQEIRVVVRSTESNPQQRKRQGGATPRERPHPKSLRQQREKIFQSGGGGAPSRGRPPNDKSGEHFRPWGPLALGGSGPSTFPKGMDRLDRAYARPAGPRARPPWFTSFTLFTIFTSGPLRTRSSKKSPLALYLSEGTSYYLRS